LSGPERKRALEAVGLLAVLRLRGDFTEEEEIARRLGFSSPEVMRIQLRNWELPRWLTG
jgi:hypothetical protein